MNLLHTLLMFYMPIVLGFLLKKIGIIRESDAQPLVAYVVYVALPCLILESFGIQSLNKVWNLAICMMIFSLVTQLASLGAILVIVNAFCSDLDNKTKGVAVLAASFQNTAFLPLPIVISIWGDAGVTAVVFYMLINGLLMNTIGAFIAASFSGNFTSLREILRSTLSYPPMVISILGLILLVSPWTMGETIRRILAFMGDTTVPVILFTIGLRLRFDISSIRAFASVYFIVMFVRFFFSPLLNIALINYAYVSEAMMRSIIILEAGMPPAVMNSVLAEKYELNKELMSNLIPILTSFSLVLIPLWLMF